MFRLPFFGRKKLFLAFEYGLTIAQTAQEMKVEMTPEIVERAERMIEGEFSTQSPTRLAVDIIPNILSVFELDLSK